MLRLSRGLLIKVWGAFLLTGTPAGIAHGASFGAGLGAAPPPLTDYVCPGDCNRDRTVMVNEVVSAVNVVLERAAVDACWQADADRDDSVRVNELVASVNSILAGCRPLGTRRFSLNPQTSSFTAVLELGSFPSFGFTGYLDLRAAVPTTDGLAFIDITDTSDYLSVVIPAATAGQDTVICITPHKDLLPILTAGVIDCDGGTPLGFGTVQDHSIGVVGTCTAGANAGQPCTSDTDCPDGECYDAADCAAADGMLEEAGATHAGVCNGPLEATQLAADSGPGALFIGPDPSGLFKGLPATLTTETALPCGDEGEGMVATFAFTTALSRATIRDINNTTETTFMHEITGSNFSCRDFDQENSAGTLVLDVPTFDLEVPLLGTVDFISEFTLDD